MQSAKSRMWESIQGQTTQLLQQMKRREEKKKKQRMGKPRLKETFKSRMTRDFPSGAVVGSVPANAGNTGSMPGLGRSYMPRSN